jgi:hypothetical protein
LTCTSKKKIPKNKNLAGYFTSPQPWNVGWGLILRTHNMPPVLGTYPSLHNSLKYYPNSSNFQQQTNPEWERKITCNLILLLSTHLSTNLVWIIFCSVYGILAILVLKFLFKIILFQPFFFFLILNKLVIYGLICKTYESRVYLKNYIPCSFKFWYFLLKIKFFIFLNYFNALISKIIFKI